VKTTANATIEQEHRSIYEYELRRVRTCDLHDAPTKLVTPAIVAQFLDTLDLNASEQETVLSIWLDAKNQVKGFARVTIGLLDQAQSHAREVFRGAIINGAARVILAHNHPSGDPTPSRNDITSTKRLVEAGNIVGIPVVDHIAVGDPGYFYSFREHELI
jgi:DNA repair protein RadC